MSYLLNLGTRNREEIGRYEVDGWDRKRQTLRHAMDIMNRKFLKGYKT